MRLQYSLARSISVSYHYQDLKMIPRTSGGNMLNRDVITIHDGKSSCLRAGPLTGIAALLILSGCGERAVQPVVVGASTASTSESPVSAAKFAALQQENERLKAQVALLTVQVEDLGQTPQVILDRVLQLVDAESLTEAEAMLTTLEQRYGPDGHAKTAKKAIAQLVSKLDARVEQARLLDARGFYALKPSRSVAVDGFVIKVESLGLGTRWLFNTHDTRYNYRDVQRGQKLVLLKTTLQSTDKSHDPNLPDIGVYAIEGKEMRQLATMRYEFRRWSSYGTYIGLYHDFKNDFAHTSSIPFTAAASIDEEMANKPFAVVATGHLCHSRGVQIGQPEVLYRKTSFCSSKDVLTTEDFNAGGYRIIAFFNKPKGV